MQYLYYEPTMSYHRLLGSTISFNQDMFPYIFHSLSTDPIFAEIPDQNLMTCLSVIFLLKSLTKI
jgi:hypothetical protein